MDERKAAEGFSALASTARLQVIKALVRAGTEGMAAGDIAEAVGTSPSGISFHLSALSEAGLIASHRQSRHIIYRVDFQILGGLVAYLMHDCCQDDPTMVACCGLGGAC